MFHLIWLLFIVVLNPNWDAPGMNSGEAILNFIPHTVYLIILNSFC